MRVERAFTRPEGLKSRPWFRNLIYAADEDILDVISGDANTAAHDVWWNEHINDVDAEYQTIDTTTTAAGEGRTVGNVQARFLRIRFVSSTGGTGLTAKLSV